MAKEYVPVFLEWEEVTADLNNEDKGVLITSMVRYAKGMDAEILIEDMTPMTRVAFRFFKGQIDRNAAISDARARARTKRNKTEQNGTNDNKEEQTVTNGTNFAKEKEKEKEKNKEKEETRVRRAGVFELFAEDDQELLDALLAFRSMRKQIKKPLTERGEELICKKLGDMTQDHTVMIQILDQSLERGWQGVFPVKEEPTPRPIQQTAQTVRGPLTFSPPGAEELRMLRRLEGKEGLA